MWNGEAPEKVVFLLTVNLIYQGMQIANPKYESEDNFAKYTMAAASLLDRVPWNQG